MSRWSLLKVECKKCGGQIRSAPYTNEEFYCMHCGAVYYMMQTPSYVQKREPEKPKTEVCYGCGLGEEISELIFGWHKECL